MKPTLKHFIIFGTVILLAFGSGVLWSKLGWGAELDRLTIEYGRYHPSGRFAEMPMHRAKEALGVEFDMKIFGPVFWRNRIHALTDPGQYRLIGWQFAVGADPFFWQPDLKDHLELFYRHHSQHLLEDNLPDMKFPVNDALMLRWTIYKR